MTKRPRGALAVLVFALGPWATPALAAEPCTGSRECLERLGRGNVCVADQCQPYVDHSDLFDVLGLSAKEEPNPEPFELYPAIIPAVGYNPALGFLIGAVGTLGMYLGKPEDTTMSSATALALITSNKHLALQLTTTLMTSGNDWQLQGDWRFLLYNQDTYGLGTGTPPVATGFSVNGWGATEPIPGAQPMKFNLVRIHQAALKQTIPNLYLGGSVRYDRYFAIVDEALNLSVTPPVVTSHHA